MFYCSPKQSWIAIHLLTLYLHSSYLKESLVWLSFFPPYEQRFGCGICFSILARYLPSRDVSRRGWLRHDMAAGCGRCWGTSSPTSPSALQQKRGAWNPSLRWLTCLSSACVLPDIWVNSIKTRISLLFSCRLTLLVVFKVVWGNGMETSRPQPTRVPRCFSHLHGGTASGVTTALFVVSWSQGGEKNLWGKQIKLSSREKGEPWFWLSLLPVCSRIWYLECYCTAGNKGKLATVHVQYTKSKERSNVQRVSNWYWF